MRQKLFILLLSFASLNTAIAQEATESEGIKAKDVRFGIYFAPNISWMNPTASKSDEGDFSVSGNGSKMGFTWGLMGEYYFAENYGLVTGIQLNTTGGKLLSESLTSAAPSTVKTADFKYSIQYLEIPLALKLRTDEISGFKFFGQLGVTVGANIRKKATFNVDYYDENTNLQTATGDNEKLTGSLTIAPVMMQLNIGGGVEYPVTPKVDFYAGIFFNNGFLPDATNPAKYNLGYQGEFKDGNIRLNNLALRLGVFF